MILSHDLGTTGDKATLVSVDGEVVASVTARYPTDFGTGGKAEQDALHWWDAVCTATRSLLESAAVSPADLVAVSFSGQMMGAVLLDEHGDPIRPAIIWADTRSVDQVDRLLARIDMEDFYRITGHRLNATYSLSKMMWIRDNEPDSFGRARRVVLAKDFIVQRLTGVIHTDPSDASSTNAFDQRANAWSDEIIEMAGLSRSLFPEVVGSTTVVGHVTRDAARATGMPEGLPVVMGGGDGPVGALGAGITSPESGAYAYLGSSSWVSYASSEPLLDPAMRTMTFTHVLPGLYVPTSTMQAGGASLAWIVNLLSPSDSGGFDDLLAQARTGSASESGLYFLPHLLGERSPHWNPKARGVFAGLAMHHGRADMVRAVIEGVAFVLRSGLDSFTTNGARIEAIDAIGGASKSDVVLGILADVWGIPVSPRDLVDEATALGAAVLAGLGVGVFDDPAVAAKLSTRGRAVEPREDLHRRLDLDYETFFDAYDRLEPWFETI